MTILITLRKYPTTIFSSYTQLQNTGQGSYQMNERKFTRTYLPGLTSWIFNCFNTFRSLRASSSSFSHRNSTLDSRSCRTLTVKIKPQQESPPAWTQEAYRPPCIEYSFCFPTWVPPPILTWPGGYPARGYPMWVPPAGYPYPDLAGGYPARGYPTWAPPAGYPPSWPGCGGYPTWVTPTAGYPPAGPGRVPPPGWTWQGTPPGCLSQWNSGKCCKALWDMVTPPVSAPWHSG